MQYPIFTSIVNSIDARMRKRGISAKKFKTWEDKRINASGLEILIDLSKISTYISALSINFDWDSFREAKIASQLDGMNNHPILKLESMANVPVTPIIDIEMTWLFDVDGCQPTVPDAKGNYRLDNAGIWMDSINKRINDILAEDDIITRWHVEVDGDNDGKYLSSINLISYFQYSLTNLDDLPAVQKYVNRQLQDLFLKANKVIDQADQILQEVIAA